MYPTLNDNYAAAVQAEMRKSVVQMKQQKAITKGSLKSGTGARGAAGRLAGLEVPFYNGVPHGEVALDPLTGSTSFERFNAPATDKMFIGLTFTGFSVEWEFFHEKDASAGNLPETRYTQRDRAMMTYMQHHNWYAIGEGKGSIAVVAAGGGGGSGVITFANDVTARGRSKGSLRLAISNSTTSGRRIEYESYTTATDTKTATFYITAKTSTTTATVVITDGGTVVAGDIVVKKGHYKKVPYGMGYHFSSTNRFYQGVNTATYSFLNSRGVDGGAALITPTVMDTAKGAKQIRANDSDAGKKAICHMTQGMYKVLAAYGYNLRQYNAEKGDADTTFAMPTHFEDEDCIYIQDADFEDGYVYIRERNSYFEYRQVELQKVSKGDGTQYVGTNSFGSTEFFDNYGEAYNMAYDARGEDGKGTENGGPNSSVVIFNLQAPPLTQIAEGQSLV